MSQKTKNGFINLLAVIAVAAMALTSFSLYSVYTQKNFGATVYTTELTDTINTFRNQVNSSTANLNTELTVVSTTINAYGSIVSENTPLAVSMGGLATATAPAANQFLSAFGSTPIWKTLASSTGITLTFTSTTATIGTTGFDSTANIAFTGNNTFAGTSGFSGALTNTSSTLLSGPTTISGSSTISGGGTITLPLVGMNKLLDSSSTVISTYSSTASNTLMSVSVVSSTLSSVRRGGIIGKIYFRDLGINDNSQSMVIQTRVNGTIVASTTIANGFGIKRSDINGSIDANLFSSNVAGQYFGQLLLNFPQQTLTLAHTSSTFDFGVATTTASPLVFDVIVANSASNAGTGMTVVGSYVTYTIQ